MSADETITAAKPPPPRHTIQTPSGEKVVFMSFGLLGELTPLIGGPERIAEFDFDTSLRDHTIRLCIAPRDDRFKIAEDYIVPHDLEVEEAEGLLDWVKEHVLNFFIRRLQKNLVIFDTNAAALKEAAKAVLPARTG